MSWKPTEEAIEQAAQALCELGTNYHPDAPGWSDTAEYAIRAYLSVDEAAIRKDAAASALAEIERLRKALAFYADPKGYTPEGVKTDGAAFSYDHPDRGAYARDALEVKA